MRRQKKKIDQTKFSRPDFNFGFKIGQHGSVVGFNFEIKKNKKKLNRTNFIYFIFQIIGFRSIKFDYIFILKTEPNKLCIILPRSSIKCCVFKISI